MWTTTSFVDHNGLEFKNISVPVRVHSGYIKSEVIGDLSKKITDTDTNEAEAEIAKQKTQEEENQKVSVQHYEERIYKLEEQLDQISLGIKKKDAENKSADIVQPLRTKYADAKKQKEFMERFRDYQLVHTGISYDDLSMTGLKDHADMQKKFREARAAGRIRLGPGFRIAPDPPTQPQKRKIDEVYIHDSDEEELVILGEWPCDPSEESILEKWMKTWDQFIHRGAPPK